MKGNTEIIIIKKRLFALPMMTLKYVARHMQLEIMNL